MIDPRRLVRWLPKMVSVVGMLHLSALASLAYDFNLQGLKGGHCMHMLQAEEGGKGAENIRTVN